MTPLQILTLRDQFLVWSRQGAQRREEHANLLARMRHLTSEKRRAEEDLTDAEISSDEARARYEQLKQELSALEGDVSERYISVGERTGEEKRATDEYRVAEEEFKTLEKQHIDAQRDESQVVLAKRARKSLEDYREEKRKLQRDSIERRLNEKIGVLLGGSRLIRSAQLDENFVMKLFDEFEEEVARYSISAGMRQLTATSLLWALMEEANRPLPVVIDTPLGRIDRENRAALVREYYPRAGKPLILLPTNTELAGSETSLLEGHIRREYRIENSSGYGAEIRQISE